MSDKGDVARNPIGAKSAKIPGGKMPLFSLAPNVGSEHHRVYVTLLERAIEHPDIRSVAVTGPYGSGKSSVIRSLPHRWVGSRRWPWLRRRVVTELSLSSLEAPRELITDSGRGCGEAARAERANHIQKELVKQLLYRLPTWRTPRSRFPRASTPRALRTALVGAVSGLLLVGLAFTVVRLGGWTSTVDASLQRLPWAPVASWLGAVVLGAVVAGWLWRSLSGRVELKGDVKANALTVSLGPNAATYFDQYLDEIVYFFEVSQTDVLVLEDIDRFADAAVFDTLRALGTLVNASKQVGRRVVFVYAVRDSVLSEIGDESHSAGQDLDRSNRAKYFDVIIPVVPFATTHNARDLLMSVMEPETTKLDTALIRLASRHVADMRTMWSLRNEYEVHADRLLRSRTPRPGITETIVFALVLLRATTPADYEAIRLSDSELDTLHGRWRDLVNHNIGLQTGKLGRLRADENGHAHLEDRAQAAGEKLDAARDDLLRMVPTATKITFGEPLTDGLGDIEGWSQIVSGTPLWVNIATPRNRADTLSLSADILERLLGIQLDAGTWTAADADDKIEDTFREIAFLRHHTWKDLLDRPDLTVPRDPETDGKGSHLTFADLVNAHVQSALAREMIEHGYLTADFARFTSMFYGRDLGFAAEDYLARYVGPGKPQMDAKLSPVDVSHILRVQDAQASDDADIFDDPSIYNLDILAYLLRNRPAAAGLVARHLAERWGDLEQALVAAFIVRADHPDDPDDGQERGPDDGHVDQLARGLVGAMAPHWPQGLHYVVTASGIEDAARVRLVDTVLEHTEAVDTSELGPAVGEFLSAHYPQIPTITGPDGAARAAVVMEVVAGSGARIARLGDLNAAARSAALERSVYPVTPENLRLVGASPSLDALSGTHPYRHLLDRVDEYLVALSQLDPPGRPVTDSDGLGVVLRDMSDAPACAVLALVQATANTCRIVDLSTVPATTRQVLVRLGRTDATYPNVTAYVEEYRVDDDLGGFLAAEESIRFGDDTPQSNRAELAVVLLAARTSIPSADDRVRLAHSLEPGELQVSGVQEDDAGLVGLLLRAGLLADEPATFTSGILTNWTDFQSAVRESEGFYKFVRADTVPPNLLAQSLADNALPDPVQRSILASLPELLAAADASQASEIATALTGSGTTLDPEQLGALLAAGAGEATMLRLVAAQGDSLPVPQLQAMLADMGGDYAKAAVGRSAGHVAKFPDDPAHRAVLERLLGVTHRHVHSKRGELKIYLIDVHP